MTLPEASKRSGFAVWTLQKFARQGKFLASKPKGNKGGWVVNRPTFDKWLHSHHLATMNRYGK